MNRIIISTLGLLLAFTGFASVITVDNNCSLINAIESANSNAAVGMCVAGDDVGGNDSISLTTDIVLTAFYDDDVNRGRTGTPAITSNIVLEGNGHEIKRDESLACVLNTTKDTGEFRLMRIAFPGVLDLRNVILKNGCADGTTTDSKIGGAVLNFNGTLLVSNSIIQSNAAEFRGGGVDTTFATSTITNSYFVGNQTNFAGAGLSNFTSVTTITGSTFENNTAGNRGGAVFNVDGTSAFSQNAIMVLLNNTFSGNTANQTGGAIYNDNAQINNSHFNTLSGNTSPGLGSAIYNSASGDISISHFLFENNTNLSIECMNDNGAFLSTSGLTDNVAGGCASTQSASINLLPLTNNGCMTAIADGTCAKTHGLASNSAAISNTVSNLTDFDQRGFVVIDGKRDTGAFQFLLPEEQCGNNQLGLITATGNDFFVASVDNEFELNQAIICANLDDTTTDTITLSTNITLTHQITKNNNQAATGTPLIDSHIVMGGNGFVLQRDLNFSCTVDFVDDRTEFRIFEIDTLGQLDLKQITLSNGCADSSGSLSDGGAVYNRGTLSLENSRIKDNQSSIGGGLANTGTVLFIKNSIISGNAANQDGGGMHNSGSISEMINSEISKNQASFGAGIFNNSTITNLSDSTFSANQASFQGGGIYNNNTINLIKNSTFSGNQAISNGGAIYDSSGMLLDIFHATFSNNNANDGGAIFISNSSTEVNINKSLFHENLGTPADCGGSTASNVTGNNNLTSKTATDNVCNASIATGLSAASVADLADNGCFFTQPLGNGSCVKTHALLASSEAINFIGSSFETKDQRGFTRTDASRDVGAFEFLTPQQQCSQSNIDISSAFTKTVTNINDLSQAIVCANANNTTTDTINLVNDITIAQAFENIDTGNFNDIASKGRTGTPAILSPLVINGMGFSLMRDTNLTCGSLAGNLPEDPDRFRLLRIADTGSLELSTIILVNGCVSQNSQVHKFYGGGIYNQGNLSVTDSVFSKNGAATGAGIYNYQGTVSQISNSIFEQNNVTDFFGAGLTNDDGQIISIMNNAFLQNSAFFGGGGIANTNNGTITTIVRNTFDKNNSVFAGAGIYNLLGAVINTIENNTFSGNTGSHAISNESLITEISNCTFVNNGFGIHAFNGTINSINNSLIDACLSQNGGVLNGSNNLSDDINHSCPGTTLTPNLNIDTNLIDNGCSIKLVDGSCAKTHAINAGSDAIDQGNANATNTDQRGFERLGTRDIGAFEFDSPTADVLFKNGFED